MNLKEIAPKGEGYFCIVKRCIDTDSNIEFARKELLKKHYENNDFKHRLLREIQLLQDLSGCENIIELISHGHNEEEQKLWYIMPCADQNLYEYIKKNNSKITIEDRFYIIEQIINAIEFAHAKDVLHRDLSPTNVLVFKKDTQLSIKVCDFGLGKNEESISFYTKSSASGYGQILYVSPEQREKLKDATKESDIYSLGKLIYFIFTGKDPVEIKPFPLSSIVTIATSDSRYKSINELKEHFYSIKKLIFGKEIPLDYLSIHDFLSSHTNFNWNTFYEIAMKANYGDHVYTGFIAPIISLFKDINSIQGFYQVIGKDRFINFIKFFSDKLSACYQSSGYWPFSEMTNFGEFFRNIFLYVDIDEVKFVCLKNLWDLAYEFDRWDVQKQFKSLLQRQDIPESIQAQFADYIAQSQTSVDISNFEGIKLPISIKLGIIEANEIAKSKIKKRTSGEIDFGY